MSSFASLGPREKTKVTQLQQFTNVDDRETLVELLGAYKWDVQRAANAYFSGEFKVSQKGKSKAPSKSVNRDLVEKWFEKYAEAEQPDTMQAEGISVFCDDIEVSPEDAVLLVISKHFEAENMLVYTKEEFLRGMESIGVDSLDKFKTVLPALRAELEEDSSFKEVYMFTFKWACPPGQKSLPVDTATALWQILLEGKFPLLSEWSAYLNENRKHSISRDEWQLLLEFASTVDSDLQGYDESAAWPVVIDTFVEYLETKRKK